MSDISALEEIGLQEVSKRTHIEVKTLQQMVNKEFDQLGRINTLGFLKIISREYNLDLSDWQSEFEAYCEDKKESPEGSRADGLFLVNEPPRSIGKWPFIVFLLLIVVGVAWYFDAWKHTKSFIETQTKKENKESNSSYTTPPIVEEVEETLASMPIVDLPDESNRTDAVLNLPLIEDNVKEGVEEDEVLFATKEDNNLSSTSISEAQDTKEDSDQLQKEPDDESDKTVEESDDKPQSDLELSQDLATSSGVILPNTKIWVGVIYLDTKKRDSFLTNEPIELDLTKEQIITTGHGNFSLTINEDRKDFVEEMPKRFHWIDGEMKDISLQEFIELNGGSSW